MTIIASAIQNIHAVDDLARSGGWLQRQSATAKIVAAFVFIVAVMSRDRYALWPVLAFDVAAVLAVALFRLPWPLFVARLKCVGLTVLLLGAVNPFFDRATIDVGGGLTLSGGVVSLLVLWGKAFAAVAASFILTAGTPLPAIGKSLRRLGFPAGLVTTLLLIYRYIVLVLVEAEKMRTAYALRAAGKAMGWRVWTSLLGLLLMRSLDRAEQVRAAMELRGFDGEL